MADSSAYLWEVPSSSAYLREVPSSGLARVKVECNRGRVVIDQSPNLGKCTVRTNKAYDAKVHTIEVEKTSWGGTLRVKITSTEAVPSLRNRTTFVNGKMYAEGEEIDASAGGTGSSKPLIVYISIPRGFNLAVNLHSHSQCVVTATIDEVKGTLGGQASLLVEECRGVDVDLSGQSSICATLCATSVVCVECSDQSSALVNGRFSRVAAECSDQASIFTQGACEGSYNALASGQSTIRHNGEIHGDLHKEKSGRAHLYFPDKITQGGQRKRSASSSLGSDSDTNSSEPRKKKSCSDSAPPPAKPSIPPDEKRAFDVLGLLAPQDFDIIRAVYLKKCLKLHPDRVGVANQEAFKDMQNAYDLLEGLYGPK